MAGLRDQGQMQNGPGKGVWLIARLHTWDPRDKVDNNNYADDCDGTVVLIIMRTIMILTVMLMLRMLMTLMILVLVMIIMRMLIRK